MLRSGVIKEGEGGKIYDTFRNRIIFPIFDNAKRVVAFTGRIFGDEKDTAKYLNSPETELFKKSDILYGFHIAKNGIRRLNFSILVEGQMDLLMCHQAGWDNTVATSGTALTDGQLALLKRISPNIIIAYDNDPAGNKASLKAFQMALKEDFNVKAVRILDKDPADLILKDKDEWKKAIKEARHIVTFSWENLIEQKLDKEKFIARFRSIILPLLLAIQSDGERMRMISLHQMALKTGIREEHLLEEIHKMPSIEPVENLKTTLTKPATINNSESTPARRLFGILFASEKKEIVGIDYANLEKELKKTGGDNYNILKEKYANERERLIFEVEALYGEGIEKNEVDELLNNFEDDVLRELLLKKMQELQQAEMKKNDKEVQKLLAECQEITKRLSTLKSP